MWNKKWKFKLILMIYSFSATHHPLLNESLRSMLSFISVLRSPYLSHPTHFSNCIYPSPQRSSFHYITFYWVPIQHFFCPFFVQSSRREGPQMKYVYVRIYMYMCISWKTCLFYFWTHVCIGILYVYLYIYTHTYICSCIN